MRKLKSGFIVIKKYIRPYMRTNITNRLRVTIATLLLLIFSAGAQAADYVLTYTTGGTTYYLARNGTSGVTRTNSFDPTTCIWSCSSDRRGQTASTLDNSDGNRYLFQMSGNTRYFLYYNNGFGVTAVTNGSQVGNSDNNRWRTNGTYVRCRNGSTYINLANGVAANTNANTASNARPYTIEASQNVLEDNTTAPVISMEEFGGNNITLHHTALSGSYIPANSYTIYTFNNGNQIHNYYNGTDYGTNIPTGVAVDVSNLTPPPTYTWSVTSNNNNASIDSDGNLTIPTGTTGDVVVHLTVSGISPLDKTVDYTINVTHHALVDNTTNPTISVNSFSGNKFNLSHTDLGGTYTPEYTTYRYDNSNHNWYGNSDHGNTAPSAVNANTLSPTYTWSVQTGGAYASFTRSPGELTITDTPTGNIVVRLTVSDISPIEPDKTVDFTLTRASVAESSSTVTELSTPTISPASKTLDYGGSQEFRASATATVTTTTTPEYITLANGGTTYYYYSSALHDAAPSSNSPVVTHPTPTYSWSLTGANFLTPTSGTGSDITISYANASANGATATLSVTASTPGTSNKSASASITANRTLPTAIEAGTASISLASGESETFSYTLTPVGAYDEVTVSSGATGIASVSKSGNTITVTAVGPGSTDITLSAARPGSTPDAVTATVPVTVKEKCVTPVINIVPSADGTTATVTISTTTTGATIYYTIDGSAPTTSSSEYSAPFSIDNGVTVKAIAVKTDAIDSEMATASYSADKVATPTIDISSSGVTFSCETAGVTFHYTINDEIISTSSASANSIALSGLSDGDVIRVIAAKAGMRASDVALKIYYTLSGVSGGIVVLNDYEDHNWSYYLPSSELPAGYPDQLHSAYPRNVKITYYGNGNTVSTSNDANPADNTFTASTNNSVKVGIDADASTFVYYKTLERDENNRFPYKLIPNPFSVRPTYGNGDTRWRGFYKWRIKSISGGAIYAASSGGNALAVGSMLDAEETYYFQPADITLTNAKNDKSKEMQIELEALWARAYVGGGYQASVGYERNFVIGGGAVNFPATYSAIYPNGTTNGTIAATMADITNYDPGNGGRSLNYDTKFEYINLTGNRTYTANNHYLCFGRGISIANNAGTVQGINANATNLDYTIRIESGHYYELDFIRVGNTTVSGRYYVKSILGCDYDRATGTNNRLSISENRRLFFSSQVSLTGAANRDAKTFDLVVKSGQYQSAMWSNQNGSGGGGYENSFYCGPNQGTNNYPGIRLVVVEGGEMGCLNGGRGTGGAKGTYAPSSDENPTFTARIKGGIIHGAVFGGAADSDSPGSRRIVVTGGIIEGWIAAGANGTGSSGGTNSARSDGNSYIYVGGDALVGGPNIKTINQTVGGQVFGAGRGQNGQEASINNSNVVVADDVEISGNGGGNVYGGGYTGYVKEISNVYVLGGTVEGKVFGGAYGNGNAMQTVNVTMDGGMVTNGVYGGSNSTGTVGKVTMQIDGGTVGDGEDGDGIFGGGYGQPTVVSGNVDLTLGATGQTEGGVLVNGDVYGGSALGTVNTNTSNHTYVTLNKGTIIGSLYGGALGSNTIPANVNGPVIVTVNGGTVNKTDENGANGSGGVYGCNNINGAPQSTVAVIINGTDQPESGYALYSVYGGGNRAAYEGTPTVTVNNCDNKIEYIYGGGNAASVAATDVTVYGGNVIGNVYAGGNGTANPADVSGNTSVKIYGGTINNVFGGSNSQGTIGGSLNVYINSKAENTGDTPCPMIIGDVYSGGNMAASKAGKIEIVCTGDNGRIENVYGGARAADISTGITLDINGGNIGNVFGGNNIEGTISGNIVVNVEDKNNCTFSIDNVYGGGNLASYGTGTDYPQVNIKSGTITKNVYGGGLGASATVTGNPQVTLTGGTIGGDVFGGGDAAPVTGNPVLTANASAVSAARLFGGGKGSTAVVTGDTKVDVLDGTYGYVFGGGDAANMTGTVTVNIKGGTITNDVYGGGALANTNTSSGTTTVTLTGGTVKNVYGGGLGDADHYATVGGPVEVKLNEGVAETAKGCIVQNAIFGCNNVNGSPLGTVTVHVFGTQNASASDIATKSEGVYDVKAVYGGGNEAEYLPTDLTNGKTVVIIDGCGDTSIDYVYGGGNAASVPATDVTVNGCYEIGWVFGGGNGKDALANGNPNPGANVGYHKYTIPEGSTDEEVADIKTDAEYGSGETAVKLYGGTIHNAFGGSNTRGNVRYMAEVELDHPGDDSNTCTLVVDYVFGAGNEAPMDGSANIILGCVDYLSEIYGGANQADLNSDVVLTIQSGSFGRVFGGNNVSGVINGTITVNIEETGCKPIIIGQLYGGGNKAPYEAPMGTNGERRPGPTVNVKSFTSIGEVYGGGLGVEATITGDTYVNINEAIITTDEEHSTKAYTGQTIEYSDGTEVTLPIRPASQDGSMGVIGAVYGGGNAAKVIGNTNVNIATLETVDFESLTTDKTKQVEGANITGNIYGGGNQAEVTGKPTVTIGRQQP